MQVAVAEDRRRMAEQGMRGTWVLDEAIEFLN